MSVALFGILTIIYLAEGVFREIFWGIISKEILVTQKGICYKATGQALLNRVPFGEFNRTGSNG
jgi:hypothetical protein